MKKIFFLVSMAILLAGCSSDDDGQVKELVSEEVVSLNVPVDLQPISTTEFYDKFVGKWWNLSIYNMDADGNIVFDFQAPFNGIIGNRGYGFYATNSKDMQIYTGPNWEGRTVYLQLTYSYDEQRNLFTLTRDDEVIEELQEMMVLSVADDEIRFVGKSYFFDAPCGLYVFTPMTELQKRDFESALY